MFCGKGGSVQVANARDSAQLRAGRSDLDSDGRLQGMVLRPLEHGVPSTGRRFPLGGPVESRCQKRKFGQVSLTGSLCPNGISGFLRFPVSPPAPPRSCSDIFHSQGADPITAPVTRPTPLTSRLIPLRPNEYFSAAWDTCSAERRGGPDRRGS